MKKNTPLKNFKEIFDVNFQLADKSTFQLKKSPAVTVGIYLRNGDLTKLIFLIKPNQVYCLPNTLRKRENANTIIY